MAESFRRRVQTRLAWLDLSYGDLATIIGMDRSTLSRAIRVHRPRNKTVLRISLGLGLQPEQLLCNDCDPGVLLSVHPALQDYSGLSTDEKVGLITSWYRGRLCDV